MSGYENIQPFFKRFKPMFTCEAGYIADYAVPDFSRFPYFDNCGERSIRDVWIVENLEEITTKTCSFW